jgi:transcriptional regulator
MALSAHKPHDLGVRHREHPGSIMYQPKHFRNDDHARLHDLIRGNALGILITVVDGSPKVNHVPVVLDAHIGICGRLRFHLARANPLADLLQSPPEGPSEVMFVFRGEQTYVSPDWYGQENMVPTWNYAVVHAHGHVAVLDDNDLIGVLDDLSATQEGALQKTPWTTQKMDQDLYREMRRAIVGFQMPIERLIGKSKMSQNRPDAARAGVISALTDLGSDSALKTAATMRELLLRKQHNSTP